jgi:hypothetical protein
MGGIDTDSTSVVGIHAGFASAVGSQRIFLVQVSPSNEFGGKDAGSACEATSQRIRLLSGVMLNLLDDCTAIISSNLSRCCFKAMLLHALEQSACNSLLFRSSMVFIV